MAALDTNVLVRWLTNDDPVQSRMAAALFDDAIKAGEILYVPVTVLLETEWVLRSRYRFGKAALTGMVDGLLSARELELQDEAAIEYALWLFKQDLAEDFADCLHVALASTVKRGPLMTFDAAASRLAGARHVA